MDEHFPQFPASDEIIKKDLSEKELFGLVHEYTDGKTYSETNDFMKNFKYSPFYRFGYCAIFGWSIPSETALEKINEFVGPDTVLEIAAGRGLWSALMKKTNMNVITTSIADGHYFDKKQMEKTWTDIELLDCVDAVTKYGDANCLFISWGSGQLYRSLRSYNGKKLVVIGEGIDGCTDALDYVNEFDFKLVSTIDIPCWDGIHDAVFLYSR